MSTIEWNVTKLLNSIGLPNSINFLALLMPSMLWSNTRKILPPYLHCVFPQVFIHPEQCDEKILAWYTLRQHLFLYTMFSIIQYDMKWVFAIMSSVRQNMENFEVLNFADVKHRPLMQIVKHVKWSTFSLNIQINTTISLIEVEWHKHVPACWSIIGSDCGLSSIQWHFVVGANCGLLTN